MKKQMNRYIYKTTSRCVQLHKTRNRKLQIKLKLENIGRKYTITICLYSHTDLLCIVSEFVFANSHPNQTYAYMALARRMRLDLSDAFTRIVFK